jgi:outer membrane protein assembly factor BamB
MRPPSVLYVGLALSAAALSLMPTGGAAPLPERAFSWPMLGGSPSRNPVSPRERDLPADWCIEKGKERHVKWAAALGTRSYGTPVVAGGRVFVGTNNDRPRDPKVLGDKGVMMCFDARTGKLLWQIVHDKLLDNADHDLPRQGVASTPAVDGDRLYYLSNRCELVCADVAGDGGGGPKVLWSFDLIDRLGVYPRAGLCTTPAHSSPLVLGDLVFAVTTNGVNSTTGKVHNPWAPSLVALDKRTGKLVWSDASPGDRVLHGQWSSPAAARIDGKWQVIWGGGDGWLRGNDALTGKPLWKFDCNPKAAVVKPGGRGDRNAVLATPVVYENKVYVATGQDPENHIGAGHLWCVDPAKKPANKDLDLSPVNDNFDPAAPANRDSGLVWHLGGPLRPGQDKGREWAFGRTVSSVCVHDGLVYAVELAGYVQCLDARTGRKYWEYDLQDETRASPYYADGKVFISVMSGGVFVFKAGREPREPVTITADEALKVSPVAVGGVLYVNDGTTLYAIAAR